MKYYTSTTEYNCGIDLHAHQMYACVIPIGNRDGKNLIRWSSKPPGQAKLLNCLLSAGIFAVDDYIAFRHQRSLQLRHACAGAWKAAKQYDALRSFDGTDRDQEQNDDSR